MTTPNNTILTALNTILLNADLGYAIAWPGLDFTPPANDFWLEINYLPNAGIQAGLSNNATTIEQGIYQVTACGRPGVGAGKGLINTQFVATQVQDLFQKGLLISGLIRISRSYQMSHDIEGDKIMVPVTVEYSR
mgnify:CR=1 FL=1